MGFRLPPAQRGGRGLLQLVSRKGSLPSAEMCPLFGTAGKRSKTRCVRASAGWSERVVAMGEDMEEKLKTEIGKTEMLSS